MKFELLNFRLKLFGVWFHFERYQFIVFTSHGDYHLLVTLVDPRLNSSWGNVDKMDKICAKTAKYSHGFRDFLFQVIAIPMVLITNWWAIPQNRSVMFISYGIYNKSCMIAARGKCLYAINVIFVSSDSAIYWVASGFRKEIHWHSPIPPSF